MFQIVHFVTAVFYLCTFDEIKEALWYPFHSLFSNRFINP